MNNLMVLNLFNNIERDFSQICLEIDSFMGSTLQWADEISETIEQECVGNKNDLFSFQLPKTPSEKKTRNRKTKRTLTSKCSVINSTVNCNDVSNLNDTISRRTRAAHRAATLKVSQLNITKDRENFMIEAKGETEVTEKNAKDLSEKTFVLQETTSTRTKPVLKNKIPEFAVPESSTNSTTRQTRSRSSLTTSGSPEEQSSEKIVKTPSESPGDEPNITNDSRNRISTQRISKKNDSAVVADMPEERPSRKKVSRTLSQSPVERHSRHKMFRTLSGSPVIRSSGNIIPRTPSPSPLVQPSTGRITRLSSKTSTVLPSKKVSITQCNCSEVGTADNGENYLVTNMTVTIKREATPKVTSTFIVTHEDSLNVGDNSVHYEEKTPIVKNGRFTRLSKTSTPVANEEKTPIVNIEQSPDEIVTSTDNIVGSRTDATFSIRDQELTLEKSGENPTQKKRKFKKEEETFKENIEEVADTVRITRTKSKAIKKMMEEEETRQADLAVFAKKILNRAKMTSLKKNQLATLLENNISTPKNGPGMNNVPFGNLTSKSKYHLLLSSSKILKTPLATLSNSAVKNSKPSSDKGSKKKLRQSPGDIIVKTATKPAKGVPPEKEIKLKAKKDKEEEAAMKRQNVIKSKQEELKRKNELKHLQAMKQREKLEQEKYNNMIQSEKEKEERHKLILQERQMKLKEEAFKKKMMTQQKIAETTERRRLEEEARIAKLKELEAEEERLALEKQREQERQEKRAQERLAQKKAREEYEMQLKLEQEAERLRAEKMSTAKKHLQSASKYQSASKRPKFGLLGEKRDWDYKSRNENDYGLEDEHSEVDSEEERNYDKARPPVPWAKKILNGKCPVKTLPLEVICEYMPCSGKSPDIIKMFNMTPSKRIKRTSSAIWNTPRS